MSTELTAGDRYGSGAMARLVSAAKPGAPAKERLVGLSPTCSPSTNPRIERRVTNLDELMYLAGAKCAVVGRIGWLHKPKPAAWVVSMQARMVHQALRDGVYLYNPKRPRRGGDPVR